MKTSRKGINLIKRFEGFCADAYICPAGKNTIGYGHLIKAGEMYATISEDEAEDILIKDISEAEKAVESIIKSPLTQGQFDALVSFTFNLGSGNLRTSTLTRKINDGDYEGAAKQFDRWVYAGNKKLPGLVERRKAERELFEEAT